MRCAIPPRTTRRAGYAVLPRNGHILSVPFPACFLERKHFAKHRVLSYHPACSLLFISQSVGLPSKKFGVIMALCPFPLLFYLFSSSQTTAKRACRNLRHARSCLLSLLHQLNLLFPRPFLFPYFAAKQWEHWRRCSAITSYFSTGGNDATGSAGNSQPKTLSATCFLERQRAEERS